MAIRTARELLNFRYSDEMVSSIVETDVTVGVAAIQIATRNGSAIERIITNNGANTIYVSSKVSVAANTGIALAAGATLTFTALDDFDLASCDLFAISLNAGNPVHVISTQLIGAQP